MRFLSLLRQLLDANEVNLTPLVEGASGYFENEKRVGWIDGHDVYLLDNIAFEAVRKLAEGNGQPITASLTTIRRCLRDGGKLASTGKDERRDTIPIRKTIGDKRPTVLHLRADALEMSAPSSTPIWIEPAQQT